MYSCNVRNGIMSWQKVFEISGVRVTGFLVQGSLENLIHLSEQELIIWTGEKQYRRFGLDWISGRLAAKLSALHWMNSYGSNLIDLSTISIINDTHGVPYIVNDGIQTSHSMSISHSCGFGLAFYSSLFKGIGCDLEMVKKRNKKLTRFYLTSTEGMLWNQHDLANQIDVIQTLTWSIKEATIKCLYASKVVSDVNVQDILIYPISANASNFRFKYHQYCGEGSWAFRDLQILTLAVMRNKDIF